MGICLAQPTVRVTSTTPIALSTQQYRVSNILLSASRGGNVYKGFRTIDEKETPVAVKVVQLANTSSLPADLGS